jgi:hypothetical protein
MFEGVEVLNHLVDVPRLVAWSKMIICSHLVGRLQSHPEQLLLSFVYILFPVPLEIDVGTQAIGIRTYSRQPCS